MTAPVRYLLTILITLATLAVFAGMCWSIVWLGENPDTAILILLVTMASLVLAVVFLTAMVINEWLNKKE